MATRKEIHNKLLKDISVSMDENSPEYNNFIKHMDKYLAWYLLWGKCKLLSKLHAMEADRHLGIGEYSELMKVAELSGNAKVQEMIKETTKKLRALGPQGPHKLDIARILPSFKLSMETDELPLPRDGVRSSGSQQPDDVLSYSRNSMSSMGRNVPSPPSPLPSYEYLDRDTSASVKREQKMYTDVKDETFKLFEKYPNPEKLNKAYTQFGRTSSTVKTMCDDICAKIKATSSDIKLVWPGYKVIYGVPPKGIVFVAVTENGYRGYREILGFEVWFCKENSCNDEGYIVTNSKQMKEKPFTKRELKQLQDCLTKYSPKLMSLHSNIEIMTACSVKSTHFRSKEGDSKLSNETCIVLYVHVKGIVPLQEEVFPKHIWGFPVDVREGCFMLCGGPNDYHNTLKMGCTIGRDTQHGIGKWGTLGAFIEHNGVNYCLTSAHVLLSDDEVAEVEQAGGRILYNAPSIGVHQPVRIPSQANDQFGELVEAIYDTGGETNTGMEIAAVKIHHRVPDSGNFPDGNFEHAGFNASQPMVFNSGEILHSSEFINNQGTMASEVVKYGCTSKVTRGSFALVGTSVKKATFNCLVGKWFNVKLHGQIEVYKIGETSFAQLGDSGALVFGFVDNNKAYLRPVGILTGITTHGGAIITPISDVLDKLGVTQLKCFPSSYPEPMSGINSESPNQHFDTKFEKIKTELENMNKTIERKLETQQKKTDEKLDKIQNDMVTQNKNIEGKLEQVMSILTTKK